MKTEYAVYKGDKFLFVGTIKECAEHFKVKRDTVIFWATPSNFKRIEQAGKGRTKNVGNRKLAIRV